MAALQSYRAGGPTNVAKTSTGSELFVLLFILGEAHQQSLVALALVAHGEQRGGRGSSRMEVRCL
jgi:hypothetical protein